MAFFGRADGNRILRDSSPGVRSVQSLLLRNYTFLRSIRSFESMAKTTRSATTAVAASSAMSPVVSAQTVVSDRGFGGRISRGGTHGQPAQAARRCMRARPAPWTSSHRVGRDVEELDLSILQARQGALARPRVGQRVVKGCAARSRRSASSRQGRSQHTSRRHRVGEASGARGNESHRDKGLSAPFEQCAEPKFRNIGRPGARSIAINGRRRSDGTPTRRSEN
jgi:hypothetical protein